MLTSCEAATDADVVGAGFLVGVGVGVGTVTAVTLLDGDVLLLEVVTFVSLVRSFDDASGRGKGFSDCGLITKLVYCGCPDATCNLN
jgi:hypothetical protein